MQSDIISFISYHWNITIANNFSFIPNIDYFKAQSEIANIGVITLKNTHSIRAVSWAQSSPKIDLASTLLQIKLRISMLKWKNQHVTSVLNI